VFKLCKSNKRARLLAAAGFSILALVFLLISGKIGGLTRNYADENKAIDQIVKKEVQISLSAFVSRLGVLAGNKNALPSEWQSFRLIGANDALFPSSEFLTKSFPLNTSLHRYGQMAVQTRTNDYFFFDPTGDTYWSTTNSRGKQIPEFRCAFLIHLEAISTNSITLEILEYGPVARNGKSFKLLGHHGPGKYWNIRPTEATVIDRQRLLLAIIDLIAAKQPTTSD
jgi:hypothetical protein